jgi:hypothetical protein
MERRIGDEGLGDFARWQIETARHDPRLERGRGSMIADFREAMEEAERTRGLGVLGVHELAKTLERKERELGVSRADPDLSPDVSGTLQAYWERAESASIEIANGFPHFNAQALISMNSALDAMVEELVPSARDAWIEMVVNEAFAASDKENPEAAKAMTPELRERVTEVFRSQALDRFPDLIALAGKGSQRYERRLAQIDLAAPPDRPIPADLDQALAELGALRDVLEHRAGRVDAKALKAAPSLPYEEGQLVRISREQYRTYSAAVSCYGNEIPFRMIRSWPEVDDERDGPNLAGWRGYYRLGA